MVAGTPASDGRARRLAESLVELGVEIIDLGREDRPSHIATVVADEQADTVELCMGGGPGVLLLRELLRELIRVGRRDVSIVVHRVTPERNQC